MCLFTGFMFTAYSISIEGKQIATVPHVKAKGAQAKCSGTLRTAPKEEEKNH